MENWNLLNKGLGHAVADGQRTLFWKHSWVGGQPLLDAAERDVPHQMHDNLAAEYWDTQTGWKWEKFSNYLPREILNQIASCELFQDDEGDQLFCKGNGTGKCKLVDVLGMIHNELAQRGEASWKWLWKIKAPQRCKTLL